MTQAADDKPATNSGAQDKMVPERDLMALKAKAEGLEANLAQAKVDLETWKTNAANVQDTLRRTEAERDSVKANVSDLEAITSERDSLQTQLTAIQTRLDETTTSLLDTKRRNLATTYGIPIESLSSKSASDLEIMTEALNLVRTPKGRYDGGSSTGGVTAMTARQKIIAGLTEQLGDR